MIPNRFYRFFSTKNHAREFACGRIRVGKIDVYKNFEDARGDYSEGTAEFYWGNNIGEKVRSIESNNTIRNNISIANTAYILSTCSHDVNIRNISYKFGKFMVEIIRPTVFLKMINYAWNGCDVSLKNGSMLKRVSYDKYEIIRPAEYLLAPPFISVIQKPKIYQYEMEYRYVLLGRLDPNIEYRDYVYLKIQNSNYVINGNIYRVRQ